jgi:anti-sigma B factor antagonist
MEAFAATSTQLEAGVFLLAPRGELDLYSAPEFEEAVFALIAGGGTRIVVDLTAVSFLDSTALGVLVKGAKRLRPVGGNIVIVSRDRNVAKVFEVSGLGRMFILHESVAEAARDGEAVRRA